MIFCQWDVEAGGFEEGMVREGFLLVRRSCYDDDDEAGVVVWFMLEVDGDEAGIKTGLIYLG